MKKRINIVLILVVLGLWGTVIYRAVNQYLFSKKNIDKITPSKVNFNPKLMTKDTFLLEFITRDPFLNKRNHEKPLNSRAFHPRIANILSRPITKPITKPIENKIWPTINYYGYIKSKDKNEELIILKINQKIYKLRKNDQVDEVTVKQVYDDSIEIYFNKLRKIIKVNK